MRDTEDEGEPLERPVCVRESERYGRSGTVLVGLNSNTAELNEFKVLAGLVTVPHPNAGVSQCPKASGSPQHKRMFFGLVAGFFFLSRLTDLGQILNKRCSRALGQDEASFLHSLYL